MQRSSANSSPSLVNSRPESRPAASTRRLGEAVVLHESSALGTATTIILLLWWLAQQGEGLFVALTTTDTAPVQSGADIVSATESGSPFNVAVTVVFAALGAVHLRRVWASLGAPRIRVMAILLGAYLAWSLVTVLWSIDPALSLRRYIQLCLVILGSAGLGFGFYSQPSNGHRLFANHLIVAGFLSIAVLWITVAARGSFDLLDPSWGGAKILGIGTTVIFPVAYASFALVWMSRRHIRPLVALFCILACLFSLVVIKGRFIAAFTCMLVSIFPLIEARPTLRRAIPYLLVIGLFGYSVLAVAALGGQSAIQSIVDGVWTYATLDSGAADLGTLTGRTPLWEELTRYFNERPWAGYGFGAFWNPNLMPAVWEVVGWEAPVAHNGFLDEALATGAIGLVLILAAWIAGLVLAVRRTITPDDGFAALVITAMVFFLLCNLGDSLMQAYYRFPFWVSLIAVFAALAETAPDRDRVSGRLSRASHSDNPRTAVD